MKKILMTLTIVINILLIILIPLKLFIINIYIPESISTILAEIIIMLNIAILIKIKKIYKSMIIISIPSIIFGLLGTYCNPYWNSINFNNVSYYSKQYDKVITKKQSLEDLEYAMKYLKKVHPKLKKNTPSEIQEQYEIVKSNIKNQDTITVNYLAKEIESIFSKLNDSHTEIDAYYKEEHILKQIKDHDKNKENLIKINDIDIKEIFEQNKQYYSYEMEEAGFKEFKKDLTTLEGLDKLGINIDEIKYTFELNKKEKQYTYKKEDFITKKEYNEINNIEKTQKSFVTYEIDKENNIAILYLDNCKNNDEYKRVLKEFFTQVKENNIENIALDLRNNNGGTSSVAKEFLKYINIDIYHQMEEEWRFGPFTIKSKEKTIKNKKKDNPFNGKIYVLTSIDTFSSAMLFTQYIKDNNIGTIIGETSKNSSNGYGEITSFKLPNSQIHMQISTKKFKRINQSAGDFIEPDIKCDSKEAIFKLYDTIKSIREN